MSDRYRPIGSEVLSDGWGTLTRYEFEYRRADGTWDRQRREVYDHGDAVACLLYDARAGTVLLVRQFRLPLLLKGGDPFLIEVPAGLLEGAAPEARMRAELIEETGYEVGRLERAFDIVVSPGSLTERIACYTGSYDRGVRTGAGGGAADEGEDIEVLHVSLDEALRMVAAGTIRDAKTVVLLQHLALRRVRADQS